MLSATNLLVALIAIVTDRLFGYPAFLYRQFGHPVQWIGKLINFLDGALNRPGSGQAAGRLRGLVALLGLLAVALGITIPLALLLRRLPFGFVFEAAVAAPLLAQRDLARSVAAVADALDNGLDQARAAVSQIVGRDPARLDRSGVARAAIESLAENASDAVVAPALWLAMLGLPGIVFYKAVNTADSMIGYRSERYQHFGWAAARLDDLVNLPASRLTGLLITAAAPNGGRPAHVVWRDAALHVSPNAGWPEAAMAGALSIRLGGPRNYDGRTVDLPWLGSGREILNADDIRSALWVYTRMLNLLLIISAVLAVGALAR
jgi:adenosylcobinamide-phosphate synthase